MKNIFIILVRKAIQNWHKSRYDRESNTVNYEVNTKEQNEVTYFDYYIKYEITALKDVDMYFEHKGNTVMKLTYDNNELYLGDTKTHRLDIMPEGSTEKYYNKNSILHFVSLKKGEKYTLEIETSKEDFKSEEFEIYAFDSEKIKEKMQSVKQNINIEKIEKRIRS